MFLLNTVTIFFYSCLFENIDDGLLTSIADTSLLPNLHTPYLYIHVDKKSKHVYFTYLRAFLSIIGKSHFVYFTQWRVLI